jgi:hypothetical protein
VYKPSRARLHGECGSIHFITSYIFVDVLMAIIVYEQAYQTFFYKEAESKDCLLHILFSCSPLNMQKKPII